MVSKKFYNVIFVVVFDGVVGDFIYIVYDFVFGDFLVIILVLSVDVLILCDYVFDYIDVIEFCLVIINVLRIRILFI